jgi:type II restriction enzyme
MNRDFNEWLSNFKASISDYTYYVDFEKIYKNVDKVKVELNILNSLIGSKNIEEEFQSILIKYPETLECIPLLLAVRANEIFVKDEIQEYLFKFNKMVYSVDDYIRFMNQSGLFDLLQNHIINNLYDYVLGVEVGLDSNGRKNRGGHLMENLVESYIKKAGYVRSKDYYKELTTDKLKDMFGLDLLSYISDSDLNKTIAKKRFDFVIVKNGHYYLFETNFYASNGSKLNETARSYKMLAQELSSIDNVTFIWVTDGVGWKSARANLEETFNKLETLYSINDLENGVLETI